MSIAKTLFKWRLLPARFEGRLPDEYSVKRSILGLWSTFDHIDPSYTKYLETRGVTYRFRMTKSRGTGGERPALVFWTQEDYDIYLDTKYPTTIYVPFKDYERLVEELDELGIAFTARKCSFEHQLTVFSTKRMLELMLRYEIVKENYYFYKFVSF